MLPPGRAMLVTSPVATASPLIAMTMGIVRVAFCAALAAGVLCVTMTSTLRRTSSAYAVPNTAKTTAPIRTAENLFCIEDPPPTRSLVCENGVQVDPRPSRRRRPSGTSSEPYGPSEPALTEGCFGSEPGRANGGTLPCCRRACGVSIGRRGLRVVIIAYASRVGSRNAPSEVYQVGMW
jgi:hypothetical protein